MGLNSDKTSKVFCINFTFIIEARSCSTICLSTGSQHADIERLRVSLPAVSVNLDDLESFLLTDRGLLAVALVDLGSRRVSLRRRYSAMTLRMVRSVATV